MTSSSLTKGHCARRVSVEPFSLTSMSPRPSKSSAPLLVQDRLAVDALGHAERDARREVRLDGARDHVHARALRREHDVHARRARLLRQPRDAVLDVFALLHHQIREFVDDDHDVRQLARQRASVAALFRGSHVTSAPSAVSASTSVGMGAGISPSCTRFTQAL